jgi:CobQ/CobB/MinD/ParA nucleotide binding domain protein
MSVSPNAVYIGRETNIAPTKLLCPKTWNWVGEYNTPNHFFQEFSTLKEDIEIVIFDSAAFTPEESSQKPLLLNNPTNQTITINPVFAGLIAQSCAYGFVMIVDLTQKGTEEKLLFDRRVEEYRNYLKNSPLPDANFYTVRPILDVSDGSKGSGSYSDIIKLVNDKINEFTSNPTEHNKDTIDVMLNNVTNRQAVPPTEESKKDSNGDKVVELYDMPAEATYIQGSPYAGRVIAFTSSKGGVGKSTTALSVATALVEQSKKAVATGLEDRELKVCLVDLDTQDAQDGFFIKEYDPPTVVGLYRDAINNKAPNGTSQITEESIMRHVVPSEYLGFDTLLGPKVSMDALKISHVFYRDVIQALRQYYDVVVIDTAVNYMSPLLNDVVYPLAYKTYYLVEPQSPAVLSMTRWVLYLLDQQKSKNIHNKDKIRVVINKHAGKMGDGNNVVDLAFIEQSAVGMEIVSLLPYKYLAATSVANTGDFKAFIKEKGYEDELNMILDDATKDPGFQYTLFTDEELEYMRNF